jgi:uroporphyrin-III C-methyltransferase/precorrin-2 dehydrogenase/sirohydrochlorin ferrochelatase
VLYVLYVSTEKGIILLLLEINKSNNKKYTRPSPITGRPFSFYTIINKKIMSKQTSTQNRHHGKIYFIGSGPGNPGLITVRGATILSEAEVIIADRLAGEEILQLYANPHAIIVDVGKQGGNAKSYKQEDINQLLLQFAALYEKVVRLKGGDIAFFSNVYDELKIVAGHNIAYEIVPGITAASGASAYTGVPLTARKHASGVQLLTYYKNTVISNEGWKQLAAFDETLVFYMSSNNLLSIVEKLLNAGAEKNIPFIVVEQATTPQQKVTAFTLASFLQNTEQHFTSPSILIMGKVAALHHQFSWFDAAGGASGFFRDVENENDYLKIKSFILQKNTLHAH